MAFPSSQHDTKTVYSSPCAYHNLQPRMPMRRPLCKGTQWSELATTRSDGMADLVRGLEDIVSKMQFPLRFATPPPPPPPRPKSGGPGRCMTGGPHNQCPAAARYSDRCCSTFCLCAALPSAPLDSGVKVLTLECRNAGIKVLTLEDNDDGVRVLTLEYNDDRGARVLTLERTLEYIDDGHWAPLLSLCGSISAGVGTGATSYSPTCNTCIISEWSFGVG